MLVAAFEAVARVAEQQGARRQQLASMRAAAPKNTGPDERDAIALVALLERRVARAIGTDDVLDGPVAACGGLAARRAARALRLRRPARPQFSPRFAPPLVLRFFT